MSPEKHDRTRLHRNHDCPISSWIHETESRAHDDDAYRLSIACDKKNRVLTKIPDVYHKTPKIVRNKVIKMDLINCVTN